MKEIKEVHRHKGKLGVPGCQMVKTAPAARRPGSNPWVRTMPWRRKWQPTPVFLTVDFHGERSLVGCSPWGLRVGHDCVLTHSLS